MNIIPKTAAATTAALALTAALAGPATAGVYWDGNGVGGSLGGSIAPIGKLLPAHHSSTARTGAGGSGGGHATTNRCTNLGRVGGSHGRTVLVCGGGMSLYELERQQRYGHVAADHAARRIIGRIYPSWNRPGQGSLNRHIAGYVYITS